VELGFLEAFPSVTQLIVCGADGVGTALPEESRLKELVLVRCRGELSLETSSLDRVSLLDCDEISLGAGLARCRSWLVSAGPNRPKLPEGLGALDGIEHLTIQWEWFFSEDITGVLDIKSLKELSLVGGGYGKVDLGQLRELPELRVLEMVRHNYDAASLAPLGHLEALYFGRGKKTDLPAAVRGIAQKKRA